MINQKYGEFLEKILGGVKDVDVDEDGVGWDPFLRVRAWLDITRLLLRDNLMSIDDAPSWIMFKYERLSNYCFKCGVIEHAKSGCPKGASSNKIHDSTVGQYGAWLRAFPAKIS